MSQKIEPTRTIAKLEHKITDLSDRLKEIERQVRIARPPTASDAKVRIEGGKLVVTFSRYEGNYEEYRSYDFKLNGRLHYVYEVVRQNGEESKFSWMRFGPFSRAPEIPAWATEAAQKALGQS